MLKSYYWISLYAYHLIYTSKDILKAFKKSVLFEDKKLFTEAIIPTIKNSIQYQSQKTAIRHMDDDRAYIKCGINMDTMVEEAKRKPQWAEKPDT